MRSETPGERSRPDEGPELSGPAAILQVWGLAEPASRGPRARLSVPEVAAAACDLADAEGYEAVTLSAVAARLGLTTTALYRYVDSKDTLTELMTDHALGPAPEPGQGGAAAVHAWVEALWGRYAEHPWLATYPLRSAPRCPHAFAWLDSLVRLLVAHGDERPVATAMAVDVLVRGYAAVRLAAGAHDLSPGLTAEVTRRYPAAWSSPETFETPEVHLHRMVDLLLAG